MVPRPSRRFFLGALVGGVTHAAVSELKRLRDPATEFELLRLTDPGLSNCRLPASHLRSVASRGNSLFYLSDRSGSMQAWRMQLTTGESLPLTTAKSLNPEMASATFDDRGLVYFDGGELIAVNGKRNRTVYASSEGWSPEPPFALSTDNNTVAFGETDNRRHRLRLCSLRRSSVATLYESNDAVLGVEFRPRPAGSAVLYRTRSAITVVGLDGRNSSGLKLANGEPGEAHWSADGTSIHYLLRSGPERRVLLRDYLVEDGSDKLVGSTTQFVSFARNRDSSVFAGVSGSVAAPYVLLLIRAARRELAVAEHKATVSERTRAVFSPDSQRLLYHTDREGRYAIYTIALERFIEKTDEADEFSR